MCPDDPELLEARNDSASGDPSVEAGLERLLSAVEALPLRYAPFYGRLATLWDLGENDVEAALERAKHPSAFRATGLPGIRRMTLRGGASLEDASVALLHLEPGARFPQHRHEGHELVLVLEGSFRDADRDFEPGDLQVMPPGSTHAPSVNGRSACVAAVVSRGFAFTSLPLRLIQIVSNSRR